MAIFKGLSCGRAACGRRIRIRRLATRGSATTLKVQEALSCSWHQREVGEGRVLPWGSRTAQPKRRTVQRGRWHSSTEVYAHAGILDNGVTYGEFHGMASWLTRHGRGWRRRNRGGQRGDVRQLRSVPQYACPSSRTLPRSRESAIPLRTSEAKPTMATSLHAPEQGRVRG
jgi:hypothetical protein